MKGKAFDLNAAISYQKNSVESKEIIKSPKGNVTIFAFDKGQGLSEHTAPFDALVYVIDGPANKPHALKAVSRYILMLGGEFPSNCPEGVLL